MKWIIWLLGDYLVYWACNNNLVTCSLKFGEFRGVVLLAYWVYRVYVAFGNSLNFMHDLIKTQL